MSDLYYIDFEVRSKLDLSEVGLYKYATDPSTEVIVCCVSVNGSVPISLDIRDGPIDQQGQHIPFDHSDYLVAHNASFERVIWQHCLKNWQTPWHHQWICTAAMAAYSGFPRSLDGVAKALHLDIRKDPDGKRLINKMCRPDKNTGKFCQDDAEMERLIAYCKRDVGLTVAISEDKRMFELPRIERQIYEVDQIICDTGIKVDLDLCKSATRIHDELLKIAKVRLAEITNNYITTPTQNLRFVKWLNDRGHNVNSVDKQTVKALLNKDIEDDVREVLEIRLELARASVKKYEAAITRVSSDKRLRGTTIYYGAHTGRWAGTGFQTHNIARGNLKGEQLDIAIKAVKTKDPGVLNLMYGNAGEVMTNCVRSALVSDPDKQLIIVDFKQIEARVLAWLAGQQDMLRAFRDGKDVYKELAAEIFGVPVHKVSEEQRWVGKQSVLGMGYQMGWQRFMAQCEQYEHTISPALAERCTNAYRKKYRRIQQLWYDLQRLAIEAVETNTPRKHHDLLSFVHIGNQLRIRLPSLRCITYNEIEHDKDNGLMFLAAKNGQQVLEKTYGGKLTENIVQGISRDLLAAALLRLNRQGFKTVLHVHDEVVVEAMPNELEDILRLVREVPTWGRGIPIDIEYQVSNKYLK